VREGENPRGSTNRQERLGPTNGSPKGKAHGSALVHPSSDLPHSAKETVCLPAPTKKPQIWGFFFERGEGG